MMNAVLKETLNTRNPHAQSEGEVAPRNSRHRSLYSLFMRLVFFFGVLFCWMSQLYLRAEVRIGDEICRVSSRKGKDKGVPFSYDQKWMKFKRQFRIPTWNTIEKYSANDGVGVAIPVWADSIDEVKPVIHYGSASPSMVSKVEVVLDADMCDEYMPSLSTSGKWTDDDEAHGYDLWEYEVITTSGTPFFFLRTWLKGLWENGMTHADRYWIVVVFNVENYLKTTKWGGDYTFRVGIDGTNQWTPLLHLCFSAWFLYSFNEVYRGFEMGGVSRFALDDWRASELTERTGFPQFFIYSTAGLNTSWSINLPEAGVLYLYGQRTKSKEGSLAKSALKITGNTIVSDDDFIRSRDESELPNWPLENLWRNENCSVLRKIQVNGSGKIVLQGILDLYVKLVLDRAQFYPAAVKSVAVEAGSCSVLSETLSNSKTLEHEYVFGKVTGTGVYKSGETVQLVATPADGEQFQEWKVLLGEVPEGTDLNSSTLTFKVTDEIGGTPDERKQIVVKAVWRPKCYVDGLPSCAGWGTVTGGGRFYDGDSVVLTANSAEGYRFVEWSDGVSTATRTVRTVASDSEQLYYAIFEKISDPIPSPTPTPLPDSKLLDEIVPIADVTGFVATTYDGFLCDTEGRVAGTVQVKAAKAKTDKKTSKTTSKLTITVQLAGETKKISISGNYDLASGGEQTFAAKDGRTITLTLGTNGLVGSFESYTIEGVVNVFSAKDADSKAAASAAEAAYVGTYNLIADEGTFTVSVAKKGKVKVSGTTTAGKKLSVSTSLLVGTDVACAVVLAPKQDLSFTVWFGETYSVEGLTNAVIGQPGTLADGAAFRLDATALADLVGDDTYADYFPSDFPITVAGTKWSFPKAGKVVLNKAKTGIDESKLGENPSGLKLTYTAKTGAFKGSFKAYVSNKGAPKAVSVSVSGVLINGVGYGTATVKKVSIPVQIN